MLLTSAQTNSKLLGKAGWDTSMTDVIAFLNQGWVGLIVGAIGIALAMYFGVRRQRPKLVYQFVGQRLISGDSPGLPEGLQITYAGRSVEHLSLTQLIVWNKGRLPIKRGDIPPHDPIRFTLVGKGEIVKLEVTKSSRESNRFVASQTNSWPNSVKLDFEFLDEGDGALLRIWHTSRKTAMESHGTIIGASGGASNLGRVPALSLGIRPPKLTGDFQRYVVLWVFYISIGPPSQFVGYIAMIGGLVAVLVSVFPQILGMDIDILDRVATGVMGFMYVFVGVWFVLTRKRFPVALMPEELNSTTLS